MLGATQLHPKPASSAFLGLNADAAAHPLDDFAHDGKTDAGAFLASVAPLEHVEDARLEAFRDAEAPILYPNSDALILRCVGAAFHARNRSMAGRLRAVHCLGPNADLRSDTRQHELRRITQEVGETLGQPGFV